MGNREGASTPLGQAISQIPIRSLNQAPQEQSWSSGIQHQLPWSVLVDAEYIGRKGTHLYAMGYANQLDALPPNVATAFRADPSYYLSRRSPIRSRGCSQTVQICRAPQFRAGSSTCRTRSTARERPRGLAAASFPGANSIYNTAQLRIDKRFSGGLQFLFSYTFQKSIDDFLARIQRLFVSFDRRLNHQRIERP